MSDLRDAVKTTATAIGDGFANTVEMGVAGEVSLRWAAVELAEVVEEARRRHDLSPVAASALGRAFAGAVLLHEMSLRACRRLILEVAGDGPLGKVVAEVDAEGNLRGFVGAPQLESTYGADGRVSVGAAVGTGFLRVRRELDDGTTTESQVELATGEIGLDLAHFLEQSEQTNSAVMVGVLESPRGVLAAGGMMIEVLPGAPEAPIARLEANLGGLPGVSRLLESGGIPGLRAAVLSGLDVERLERRPVRFRCRCNRESLLEKLVLLSADDRAAVLDEEGRIEAECAFCGAHYRYSAGELSPSPQ